MTMPPEKITVICPQCSASYQTYHRPSMNLKLDNFDEEYIEKMSTAVCPDCKHKVALDVLVVRKDGVFEFREGRGDPRHEEKKMIDLARYDAAVEERKKNWAATDEVLYQLCRKFTEHKTAEAVNAKVSLIGRAYATGIERKVKSSGTQASALTQLTAHILKNGAEVDGIIARLSLIAEPLDAAKLERIVEEHGRFVKLLSEILIRKQSCRSFVSKYLHFHVPAVPIIDSYATAVLRRLRRWDKELEQSFNVPPSADKEYCWFVMRFWKLYQAVRKERSDVTVKRLDYFLLNGG